MNTFLPRTLVYTLVASGIGLATQANAASTTEGVYVGADLGTSIANRHVAGIDGALRNQGIPITSGNSDKQETTHGLTVGYRINPYLAVEGGYVNLGNMGYQSNTNTGAVVGNVKSQGLTAAAVGILPIARDVSVYGKLGVIDARTDLRASGSNGIATTNTREYSVTPLLGLGASYDITPKVSTQVEWNRYNKLGGASTSEVSYNTVTVGMRYKF